MHDTQSKHCIVCREFFVPDKRVGARQQVCSRLGCQQERKRRSQRRWVRENPDYFQGRYPYVKQWLAAHPDYQRRYRAGRQTGDIQDELTLCKSDLLGVLQFSVDIQDEISSKITESNKQLKGLSSVIYKTSERFVSAAFNSTF